MASLDRINVPEFERPIVELEIEISDKEAALNLARNEEEAEARREELVDLRAMLAKKIKETFSNLKPWHVVQLSRHPNRPLFTDHVHAMCDDWEELHGDRAYGDDPSIATGFASIAGRKFMVIGNRKGKTLKERVACNFGCAHPEGYRKAMSKMRLAEKLGIPILCMINTPGAYPGVEAEERGQSMAIAENIRDMSDLRVPVICVTIGEGGSGGALGIGVGDKYLIMQNSYYSVISPEGCAAILWHDGKRAEEAADVLNLTPADTVRLGIMDRIVPEPEGGAHRNPKEASDNLKAAILTALAEIEKENVEDMLETRYQRLRSIGKFKIIEV